MNLLLIKTMKFRCIGFEWPSDISKLV